MSIWKTILKSLLKVLISAVALYFVFRKVDPNTIYETLNDLKLLSIIIALSLFNISQWISALRLKLILMPLGIDINFRKNLVLYYKGMFYNLFLPGGIGGDGFKVFILNKIYKVPVKTIVGGLFLDRLFGLIGILFLISIISLFCKFPLALNMWKLIAPASIIMLYFVHFLFVSIFYKKHKNGFIQYCMLGITVNVFQAFAAIFILLSLGLNRNFAEYAEVFLFSSLTTIFPFTVGGIGTRELVFSFAPELLPVEAHIGITLSLVFFILTSMSSLTGAFLRIKN